MPIAATASGLIRPVSTHCLIVRQTLADCRPGSSSTTPGFGLLSREGSKAEARSVPSASKAAAFVPCVPMSMPKRTATIDPPGGGPAPHAPAAITTLNAVPQAAVS